jgi:hypothetical protein
MTLATDNSIAVALIAVIDACGRQSLRGRVQTAVP